MITVNNINKILKKLKNSNINEKPEYNSNI
jgi:hypothetical protein